VWMIARFGQRIGVRRPHDMAGLPLILLLASLFSFAVSPLANAVSRHAELAADRYAYELIGSSAAAVTMHQKLAASSLSHIHPPALVRWFRMTHPSTLERIVDAQRYHSPQTSGRLQQTD